MIRKLLLVSVLAGLALHVQAQNCSCSGTEQVKGDANLLALLVGKRACVLKLGGSLPGWKYEWQELHEAGGALKEASEPIAVGLWSVAGQGTNTLVTHDYGTGGSYGYKVCQSSTNPTKISFCGAVNNSNTYDADLVSGNCP